MDNDQANSAQAALLHLDGLWNGVRQADGFARLRRLPSIALDLFDADLSFSKLPRPLTAMISGAAIQRRIATPFRMRTSVNDA